MLGDDGDVGPYCTYQPSTSNPGCVAADMVEYTVQVKKGLTFTPTSVVFDLVKEGTDGAYISWSYTVDNSESDITAYSAPKTQIRRNNNANPSAPLTHNETITATGGKKVTLRLYVSNVANNRKMSMGNIKINGIIDGTVQFTVLNEAGLATFSNAQNLKIKTENVKAYKAAVNGVTITLTELDGYIPAGTGVILSGEAGTTVEFEAPASEVTSANVTGNDLKATTKADGTLETKPSSGNVYALNGDKFLEYTPDSFVAYKAYIAVEGPSANEYHIVFADAEQGSETSIESIEASTQSLTFDLNGRRATGKGLQIMNGKAVFVK